MVVSNNKNKKTRMVERFTACLCGYFYGFLGGFGLIIVRSIKHLLLYHIQSLSLKHGLQRCV